MKSSFVQARSGAVLLLVKSDPFLPQGRLTISAAQSTSYWLARAEPVIAINRHRHAPLFAIATYDIVGDLFQIIPALTRRLCELKRNGAPNPD